MSVSTSHNQVTYTHSFSPMEPRKAKGHHNSFGMSQMQIAVGLGRETGDDWRDGPFLVDVCEETLLEDGVRVVDGVRGGWRSGDGFTFR